MYPLAGAPSLSCLITGETAMRRRCGVIVGPSPARPGDLREFEFLLEGAGSSLDCLVQVRAMIYNRIEYDVLRDGLRGTAQRSNKLEIACAALV
jgi:hypothetical protein